MHRVLKRRPLPMPGERVSIPARTGEGGTGRITGRADPDGPGRGK